MKRYFNKIGLGLFLILCFSFLGFGDLSATGKEKAKWSVFIYMCGTDLESDPEYSMGTDNLKELLEVNVPENVNIIVTTGGTKKWEMEGINPKKLQRFKIEAGELKLLEEDTLQNMGESETLSNFLTWGVKNFPAEKNMVLLWNHGSGSVDGVLADEIYDLDSLTLSELGRAFKTTDFKFDIIGFDTCLSATLEIASQIQPYGSYMVASQELEPGLGWDYKKWANAIAENPDITPKELGKIICDSFFEKIAELVGDESDEDLTLSVVDLDKLPKLEKSFNQMALELSKATQDIHKFKGVYAALESTEGFGAMSVSEGGDTDMKDLAHFSRNVEPIIGKAATDVYNAVNEVVVYNLNGSLHPNSGGISFYCNFLDKHEDYAKYAAGSKSAEYLAFLDVVSHTWTAPDWVYEKTDKVKSLNFNDYVLMYTTEIGEGNTLKIKFDNAKDSMYKITARLVKREEGSALVYNVISEINVEDDENVFDIPFNSDVLMMEGIPVFAEEISTTNDYKLYSIPINLNEVRTNLRVKYDIEKEQYEVLGVWSGLIHDTTIGSRVLKTLKEGDVIEPLLFNAYTKGDYRPSSGSFTFSGDIKFSKGPVPDGTYMFDCYMINALGRQYVTDAAEVEISEGKVVSFELYDPASEFDVEEKEDQEDIAA